MGVPGAAPFHKLLIGSLAGWPARVCPKTHTETVVFLGGEGPGREREITNLPPPPPEAGAGVWAGAPAERRPECRAHGPFFAGLLPFWGLPWSLASPRPTDSLVRP